MAVDAYENWRVLMDMPVVGYDRLDTDTAGSWGTTKAGLPWSHTGGTVGSEYYVSGGSGVQEHNGVNVLHTSLLDIDSEDWDITAEVNFGIAQAAGAQITAWVCGGYSDANNYYAARLVLGTSGGVTLQLLERNGGVLFTLTNPVSMGANTASTWWRVAFSGTVGSNGGQRALTLAARAWVPATTTDPGRALQFFNDTSPLPGGQNIALMSRLETGNTDTQPVRIRFRNVSAAASQRIVDITAYADTIAEPISGQTGSTPETSGDTGGFSVTVNNSGQRFTPGNTNSPYYPNIAAGRRLWLAETFGYTKIGDLAGYLEFPEVDSWTASTDTAPRDQTILFSVVDRLARLGGMPQFASTLAAHIMSQPSAAVLIAYYPLNDGPDRFNAYGPVAPAIIAEKFYNYVTTPTTIAEISPQAGGAPPGDDIRALRLRPDVEIFAGNQNFISWYQLTLNPALTTIEAGETFTVLLWIKPDDDVVSANQLAITLDVGSTIIDVKGNGTAASPGSVWEALTILGPTVDISAGGVNRGGWDLIGLQFGYTPYVFNLLSGGTVTSGVPVGVHTGSAINNLWVEAVSGSVAHVQVYKGTFTADDYTAQRNIGLFGLEQQTTGQRVDTILDYAGVPAAERDIDPGTVCMSTAGLAGLTPLDALRAAEAAEQGLLVADGGNRIRFADRRRLYTI